MQKLKQKKREKLNLKIQKLKQNRRKKSKTKKCKN